MREAQVQFIDDIVAKHDNGNPRILMGDFNTVPESDELRFLTGHHTLGGSRVAYQDAWAAVNQDRPGHTWTRANDYTENMHWLRRDRRLDYIFVTPVRRDRRATVHAAAVVFDLPEAGANGERLFVSDHFGVTADVQILTHAEGT
jgi:endonuclease/exonuclease/phosphatase family metal-dependent hydrolase